MYLVEKASHKIMFIYHIVKGCVIRLSELNLKIDSIVFETNSYDIILGMDWLIENQVKIDF